MVQDAGEQLETETPFEKASTCHPTEERSRVSLNDFKRVADLNLPRITKNYINDGAGDQITLRENRIAFDKWRIRPRVLADVSGCDPSTECLGRRVSMPIGIAPAGMHSIAHPDGEIATTRACAKRGINMVISSLASRSIEDIRAASIEVDPRMTHAMQMYPFRNKTMASDLILRAEQQGCKAIFLTADSPVIGLRYREKQDDFRAPTEQGLPNIGWSPEQLQAQTNDELGNNVLDDSQNWLRDIPWFKSQTKMQIWVKGVLTAEDTEMAVQMGCDGIVVSNHGGRQLDGVPASIDALPECVKAAKGRVRVHIDSGIRTGVDIFKALALGAECCWLGRPALWALATAGERGVEEMLELLHDDFLRVMKLAGCRTIKDIRSTSLVYVGDAGKLARL